MYFTGQDGWSGESVGVWSCVLVST